MHTACVQVILSLGRWETTIKWKHFLLFCLAYICRFDTKNHWKTSLQTCTFFGIIPYSIHVYRVILIYLYSNLPTYYIWYIYCFTSTFNYNTKKQSFIIDFDHHLHNYYVININIISSSSTWWSTEKCWSKSKPISAPLYFLKVTSNLMKVTSNLEC